MRIEITIPAMEWTTLRKVPKKKEYKKHTKLHIGAYVGNVFRTRSAVQKRHRAWKDHARLYIDAKLRSEGWNGSPIDSKGVKLTTQAYFENKVHFDSLNVQKGMEDVLVWREGQSSKGTFFLKEDKFMSGAYMAPKYDKKNPRLIVILEGVNL